MRLGILAAQKSYYADQLVAASESVLKPSDVVRLTFDDLVASCSLAGEAIDQSHKLLGMPKLDALLVRSMPLGSLEQVIFRMDCLQAMADSGTKIVNPPKTLETAIDKWLTLHRLAQAGVAVPATIVCQDRQRAMTAFERLGGDVVVKPIFGGEGRGIMRIESPEVAWRTFGVLQQTGQVMYLQEFIDHPGYDIRVLMVGQARYAVRREARGHWLTNVAQGSQAVPHELSSVESEIAEHAFRAIGGSVLGVDLLPSRDGRICVLEVNAVPGWKATARAVNVDITRAVIEHVVALG